MSEEEQEYVKEQVGKLIALAKHVGALSHYANKEYIDAVAALEKQKNHILAMDGIE